MCFLQLSKNVLILQCVNVVQLLAMNEPHLGIFLNIFVLKAVTFQQSVVTKIAKFLMSIIQISTLFLSFLD